MDQFVLHVCFIMIVSFAGEHRKGGLFGAKARVAGRRQKGDDSRVENVLHDSVRPADLLFQGRRRVHGELCSSTADLHPQREMLGGQRLPKARKRLQAGYAGKQ